MRAKWEGRWSQPVSADSSLTWTTADSKFLKNLGKHPKTPTSEMPSTGRHRGLMTYLGYVILGGHASSCKNNKSKLDPQRQVTVYHLLSKL